MGADMTLGGLYIYPVKSCAGIALAHARLDRFGLAGDRRWLVVDSGDEFLTQRRLPLMGQIAVTQRPDSLVLRYRGRELSVSAPGPDASLRQVRVWNDKVEARDAGEAAATWLGAVLGEDCRLVFMPDDARRLVDTDYAAGGETVSFADGYPLSLVTEASLAVINAKLDAAVDVRRFRPNLVICGSAGFAEDRWRRLQIGEVVFTVAKPCARCVIPSLDPDNGAVHPTLNRVLAKTRRIDGAILFGQNLLYGGTGTLRVGDTVRVLD